MIFTKKYFIAVSIIFCCFFLSVSVLAATNTTGYAFGENVGWANFNSTNGGVTVSSTGVTGYVWLENVGWIQLDYDGVAGATNTTSTNWGVTNDGSGNLGGYAWGENIGWINFHPTNSQVIIGNGNFSGYAWSENVGWIKFDHTQTSDRPATTWTAVISTPTPTQTPTPTPTPTPTSTPMPTSTPAPTSTPVPAGVGGANLYLQLLQKQNPLIVKPSSKPNLFTKNLSIGIVDSEVKLLQQYLNKHGFLVAKTGPGSPGKETNIFGSLTKQAVIKLQEKYASEILAPSGFKKGTGTVAQNTRVKLNGE